MGKTTVVLADDHHVVRKGLRAVLEAEEDCSVIGEASDGLEALDLVERLRPDVLIVDLMMPKMNGLEVTRQVAVRSPGTRTAVLSMHASEAYVLEALKSGAAGYVLKDSNLSDLAKAVREIASGRRYLSPPLTDLTIEAYVKRAQSGTLDAYDTLSEREREVLKLAAEGATSGAIAARLFISPRTVESHRANIMRKLGLESQTDLIRFAIRRGIIPLDT